MRRAFLLAASVFALHGCACHQETVCPPVPDAAVAAGDAGLVEAKREPAHPAEPTSKAPHVEPLAVCEANGKLPLDAAREYVDDGKFQQGLSCAAQASALFPNDVLAHAERGLAFAGLQRFEESKQAFARALAIDPDSLDALLGAAHLYGVTLASSREVDELASLYAERGYSLAKADHDADMTIRFGRVSAMIFNDLGQAPDALERAEAVLKKEPADVDARYEAAVAYFELCRFPEARRAFSALLEDPDRAASAHHHLALILERDGDEKKAQTHFDQAHALLPDDYPEPVILSRAEFKGELKKALAALPEDMKKDIEGVPIDMEDIPLTDDLVGNDPPLSPTILGLFRGPPLQEDCDGVDAGASGACRSVVLYRKNLGRAVKSKDELIEQIRVTVLHEVGHLRGEDDYELAARGLE